MVFFLLVVFEINHIPFYNHMELIFNFLQIRVVAKHFFSLHYLNLEHLFLKFSNNFHFFIK